MNGNHAASGDGGGIYNDGSFVAERLTVSDNDASIGGGLYVNGTAQTTITNTTFSANTSTGDGAGIAAFGFSMSLVNLTIANNSAGGSGGGIRAAATNAPTLLNALLANNTGGNCSGTLASSDHNLSTDNTCTGDFGGADQNNVASPNLGSLASNGGPTETYALLTGSPAIDAGANSGCPSNDQRGISRPKDGDGDATSVCDLGAYEAPTLGTASMTIYLPYVKK
ncbi:MAG: hypothetical protein M1482_04855 [Chloroflexi bacterium]|nr:hypothetical protein [Chloroflexota bacterium]